MVVEKDNCAGYIYSTDTLVSEHTNRPIDESSEEVIGPEFWCTICHVKLRTAHTAIQHLGGKPHSKKKNSLENLSAKKKINENPKRKLPSHLLPKYEDNSAKKSKPSGSTNTNLTCDDCNMKFDNATMAIQHFKGKKHAMTIAAKIEGKQTPTLKKVQEFNHMRGGSGASSGKLGGGRNNSKNNNNNKINRNIPGRGFLRPFVREISKFNNAKSSFDSCFSDMQHNTFSKNPGFSQRNFGVSHKNPGSLQRDTGFVQRNLDLAHKNPGFGQNNIGSFHKNSGFIQKNSGLGHKHPDFGQRNLGLAHKNPYFGQNDVGLFQENPVSMQKDPGLSHKHPASGQNNLGFAHRNTGFDIKDRFPLSDNESFGLQDNFSFSSPYRQGLQRDMLHNPPSHYSQSTVSSSMDSRFYNEDTGNFSNRNYSWNG